MSKYNQDVLEVRESSYGPPELNLNLAGELVASIHKFYQHDMPDTSGLLICLDMICVKLARIATGDFVEDNFVDLHGYTELAMRLHPGGRTRNAKA